MIHFGGDEVFTSCFDENPKIKEFMTKHVISDYQDLVSYHIAKVRDMLASVNSKKIGVYWSNPATFYQRYREGDVLVYWGAAKDIYTMKSKYPNNKFVLSPQDYYYLDGGFGNKYGGNMWCDPYKTWWRIWSFEPSDYIKDESLLGA